MSRQAASIICDVTKFRTSPTASTQAGDWHDAGGYHRYYGSSTENGGERIVENRRGARPRSVNLCGF